MWFWLAAVMAAYAADPPTSVELVPVQREAGGCTVYVRSDGQLYLDDVLVQAAEVTPGVQARVAADPEVSVVVAADGNVPYSQVMQVMELVRWAQPRHLALEVDAMKPLGEGPPVSGAVTQLGGLSEEELKDLKPKRWKFPQNPYANTAGFTAYSLELGEFKIGLGTVAAGILPNTQIGTFFAGDVVGAFNVYGKSNVMRIGKLDGAILGQYYRLPPWLLEYASDAANTAIDGNADSGNVELDGGYLGLGAVLSYQVLPPWSLHLSVYYGRPGATGSLAFDALPTLLFPGLDIPSTDADIVAKVNGDAVVLNLATDLRFNRRDSVYVWGRAPVYARARGLVGADQLGSDMQGLDNLDVIVAYGQGLNPSETYSVAAGYMASWKHIEARVGLGVSAYQGIPVWALQAFDLSYRFGGQTRHNETDIRHGYRDQKHELKDREMVPTAPPPPPARPKAEPPVSLPPPEDPPAPTPDPG